MTPEASTSPISRFRQLSEAMLRTRIGDAAAIALGVLAGGLVAPQGYAVAGALAGVAVAFLLRLGFGANAWTRNATRLVHDIGALEKRRNPPAAPDAALLRDLPVPVLVLDADSVVIQCSEAARQVLWVDPLGRRLSGVFRSPQLLDAVYAAIESGEAASLEFTSIRAGQSRFRALLRPVDKADGTAGKGAARLLITLDDVTKERQVEKMRIDFIANASHELRTPLAAISGLVETVRGPARDDVENRERFLGIIAEQTGRMTRMVNDLLSLSRIELEENNPPTEVQDLRAIIMEAVAAMEPLAAETGNRIEPDLPEDLPPVPGVRDEITQVFVNLIGNAIKYGGPGLPIRIFSTRSERNIAVTVQDFGPGIDAATIPRLTERFFRVNKADSLKRGGTGLGLAIVKHIMNRHRGELRIESTPGEGARFTVRFPRPQDGDALSD